MPDCRVFWTTKIDFEWQPPATREWIRSCTGKEIGRRWRLGAVGETAAGMWFHILETREQACWLVLEGTIYMIWTKKISEFGSCSKGVK